MTAVADISMHKPRLGRLTEIYIRQPVYFLTLCTIDRKMILDRTSIHAAFVAFCEAAVQHGIYVGRYVLMPDHIHLFAATSPESAPLSTWIKSLKNTLSKTWCSESITAPHWQKGFFDHLLRSMNSYDEKWNYVADNPVRAGLVTSSVAWPYQDVIFELADLAIRRS